MAGMYGADVEQLRALARSFDTAATRLDNDRMSVGNAIRVQAWVGPVAVRFRAEWDSSHSVKMAQAAARLHTAASALRRNADDQERTSAVNGAAGPSVVAVPSAFEGSAVLGIAGGAIGALKSVVGAIELPQAVVEMGHAAARDLLAGKGAASWKEFGNVAEATKPGKLLGSAGAALGLASVGFGTFDTVTKALEGDTQGAIYSGAKTLISAAAVIPSPIQPIAAAAGIVIGVSELLSANPTITASVTDSVERVGKAVVEGASDAGRTVGRIADGANKAAASFLDGVGTSARGLLPW